MVCVIGMGGGDGDGDGGGGVCGSVILLLFIPNCRTSQKKSDVTYLLKAHIRFNFHYIC